MQFTTVATVAALAATVAAWPSNSSVTVDYVTEVFTAYTTFCPASTEVTFNGITYTATESTTLTITNCPCTVVKPVTTSSVVAPTTAPVYSNSTTTAGSVGTTSVKASSTPTPSTITASGGNKLFAVSGASLAGLLGLAAYLL